MEGGKTKSRNKNEEKRRRKKLIEIYLMSGSSHNGRENSSWSIVTSETGFAHAGPVVDDKSSNIFVAHGGGRVEILSARGKQHNSCSFCKTGLFGAVPKKFLFDTDQRLPSYTRQSALRIISTRLTTYHIWKEWACLFSVYNGNFYETFVLVHPYKAADRGGEGYYCV